jgi:hypothetical protein
MSLSTRPARVHGNEEATWTLRSGAASALKSPAGCSEATDEPQDLDFPLAPFRRSGAPWALSKWFKAVQQAGCC